MALGPLRREDQTVSNECVKLAYELQPLELKHIKHEEYYSPTDLYMESALLFIQFGGLWWS